LSAGEAAHPLNRFVIPTNGRDLQCSSKAVSPQTIMPPKLVCRWIKFNLVGGIGISVQLTALWVLTHAVRCNYLIGTAVAVETAVLHNFLWHQRFTWADRMGNDWRGSLVRLLQFNLANGLVSILGNLILMRALVGGLHLRILIANMLSIACCSAANFLLSEMYVFRVRRV